MSTETSMDTNRTENDFCSVCLQTKAEVKLEPISNKVYQMFFVEIVKCKEFNKASRCICVWCHRRVVNTLKLVETAQTTDKILVNIMQIDKPHCQSFKQIAWTQIQPIKTTYDLTPRISRVTSYSLPMDTQIGSWVKVESKDGISREDGRVSLDSAMKGVGLPKSNYQTQTTKENHVVNSRISRTSSCDLPSCSEFGLSLEVKCEDGIPAGDVNICLDSVIDEVEMNRIPAAKDTHVVTSSIPPGILCKLPLDIGTDLVKQEQADSISSIDNVNDKDELCHIKATKESHIVTSSTSRVVSCNSPLDVVKLEHENGIAFRDNVISEEELDYKHPLALESHNFLEIKLESETEDEMNSELDITEETSCHTEIRKRNKPKSNVVTKKTMKEVEFNKTIYTEVLLEPINALGNQISVSKVINDNPNSELGEGISKYKAHGGKSHIEVSDTDSQTTYSSVDAHKHIRALKLTEAQRLQELEERRQKARYRNATFKCEPCVLTFAFRNSYEAHMERHSESFTGHKCSICALKFEKMNSYWHHCRDHYKRYSCMVCGHNYLRRQEAMDHYLSQHANERYKCKHCTSEFRTASILKLHLNTVHEVERPVFPCPHCSQVLSTKSSYQRHVKRHNDSLLHPQSLLRPHRCEVCSRTFYTAAHLRGHQVTHSKEEFFCDICGDKLKLLRTLKIHMKRKHSDVCYECDYCQKTFRGKNDLKEHILWLHLGRGFKCQFCPKVLRLNCLLEQHVKQKHEGRTQPKDKVCQVCGKGFSHNSALKSHHRVHSAERLYRCSICPKTFKDPSSLRRHKQRVHNINNKT